MAKNRENKTGHCGRFESQCPALGIVSFCKELCLIIKLSKLNVIIILIHLRIFKQFISKFRSWRPKRLRFVNKFRVSAEEDPQEQSSIQYIQKKNFFILMIVDTVAWMLSRSAMAPDPTPEVTFLKCYEELRPRQGRLNSWRVNSS